MSDPTRTEPRATRPRGEPTEPATRVIRAASVAMLRQVLDELSDALALVETAEQAMDATGMAGALLVTLRRSTEDLRLAHQGLDLAILKIERGEK